MKSTLIASLALLCDQLSKWYVLKVLKLEELLPMSVVPPILNFNLVWNRGANFGLFSSDSLLVKGFWIALALIISGGLLFYYRKSTSRNIVIGAGLIAGGAISNALDRLLHGAVLDFLNFQIFWVHNPYSFNLADAFIFIGAALFILLPSRSQPIT